MPIASFNSNNAGSVRLRQNSHNQNQPSAPSSSLLSRQIPEFNPPAPTQQIAVAISEAIRSALASFFPQSQPAPELNQNPGSGPRSGVSWSFPHAQVSSSPVWQAMQSVPGNFGNSMINQQAPSGGFGISRGADQLNARITGSALPSISQRNLAKIRAGEYIELESLTDIMYQSTDKFEFKNEGGSFALVKKDKGKAIKTLSDWLMSFSIFFEAHINFFPHQTQALMKYQNSIIRFSSQYSFSRVYAYDRNFRSRISLDPTAAWDLIDENLFNQYLRGAPGPSSYSCYSCGSNSHAYKDCPQVTVSSAPSTSSSSHTTTRASSHTSTRPSPLLQNPTQNHASTNSDNSGHRPAHGVCYNFNNNPVCSRGNSCPFAHICWHCGGDHKGSNCSSSQ